ncbi:hypothetical protein BsWGS_09809 [Bradybaena similaris]
MQPLKDNSRHGTGVGVEMTMSLSGPPGLHRHTTLPTDSIYHYMNRQQTQQTELQHKLLPGSSERKTPVTARVTSMDLRLGNHDSVAISRDHRLAASHEVRPSAVEVTSHDAIRSMHDNRGMEILATKESGRVISEHHSQQMPQQHSHHLSTSRKYSDVRSVMVSHDKTSITTELSATRDVVQLGQSLGSSRPGSSHSSQQSQPSLQDPHMPSIPMTGLYSFELQSPYTAQMTMNSLISTGVQRKSGSIQLSPSGSQQSLSASVTYPVQNSGRSSDSIVASGLHPLHGQDTTHSYVSTKQTGMYSEEYNKAVATGHFLPELMKAGSVSDVKQLGQHQVVSQHRDLIRESLPDYSDPHYNSGARNISNTAVEVTSLSKHTSDVSHAVASRTAIDDQVQKPASFMNTHSPLFSKGHQSQSSISKSIAYQLGAESILRSGQEPFTSVPHLQSASNIPSALQHPLYPPSQLHQDNMGPFSDPELHPSVHLHKSTGVIRPPVHASIERTWQEGYHPLAKQTGPTYHQDDLITRGSKNCIPHHRDLESSHPPLHPANTLRMQGSISTGQPRIMYDSGNSKSVTYSDLLSHPPSAERFSVSQKELASNRPSSVGRSTQLPQNMSGIPCEDRPLPDLSEKSSATAGEVSGSSVSGISGTAALDLTKLHTGTHKSVDSPLDLTIKTKKRHVDDRETPEYDRMLCAAKRQKLDTGSPHSGISCQKVTDNSPNAIWLSSPSPRGSDNYEHRSVPLTIYSGHASSTPTLTRPHKYGQSHLSDCRMSADQRISRDRLNADSHMNRDGRVSVESRSNIDQQTLCLAASQGKMYSSSMIPDMVRHSTGTNPPMVPLTTQLQKVKEEQAYQMKLQRMSNDAVINAHTDPKQVYKDTLNSRHLELASQSPNEVVVVRHSQQHYDISEQTQQSHTQHSFIKQQQQQCLNVQQMQSTHHHQKLLNNQQEIIELAMKDSSDPLQASRASTFNLRGFTSQSALLQQSQHHLHQQQQTCVVQQHKYSSKEPPQQLSAYSHQQVLYSKETQQQSYTKEQLQFLSQQHYSRTQYSSKHGEDMDYFYHKQQQQFPSRKRNDVDGYKQTLSASQSNYAGTQKWSISHQQRSALKSAFPHAQPNTSTPGDYRATKLPPVYSRSPSHARMSGGREYDGYRYGYIRTDRLKLSDSQKSSLPQIAGPLPAGGVREESRRALSRRVSYSGSSVSGTLNTNSDKPLDNIRKKSTSSLPERIDTAGKSETNHGKSGTSVFRIIEKSDIVVEDSVKLDEIKGALSPAVLSQVIPLPNAGSCVIPDLLSSDSLSSQSAAQFVVPLSLTIPQTPSPLTSSTPSPAGASSSRPASHKAWSRKHMILNAVNQDESLKRIICSNGNKHESGGISSECKNRIIASSTCSPIPTSPKMPILSPQDDDDDGEVENEEQGVRKQAISDDPPTLDPSHMGQSKPTVSRSLSLSQTVVGAAGTPATQNHTCSSAVIPENPHTKDVYRNSSHEILNGNNNSFTSTSSSVVAKEASAIKSDEMSVNAIVVRRCTIGNTLPDQQIQQQHEEPQKMQPGSVQFQRAEVIRRNSLAGHGLGPWGHMKNIPIANVAPFIHSRDDDDKSKQQKLGDQQQMIQQNSNFPNSDSMYVLSGHTQEAPKEVMSKPDIPKQNTSTELTDVDIRHSTESPEKDDSNQPASSSNRNDSKKKKITKLRVSSPTKMKELELISPTLEYAVLKSTDTEDIKILDKFSHGSLRKSLESRMKYKHKIVREKNSLIKPKKTVKKRIQYVFDDDEDEPDPVAVHDDDDDNNDEDFEIDDGNKGGQNSSKSDAEAKARDREKRALRREQLRDQSEENASRHPAAAASSHGQTSKSSSGSKNRTRSKESLTSDKQKPVQTRPAKAASRISRRRMSSTNQRAQELKHNALVQRRKSGKRKIRRYNRNAAYEQELHREANRRAIVRAKRQASSKARERLQQQRDLSHDADNDDNLLDETWKLPETKGTSASGRKNHQHISSRHIGAKASSKSHSSSHSNKTSASSLASEQRKEDYESDVENVPDDLAAEMASDDGGKKKKLRAGKCRGRREDNDKDNMDGQDTSGFEDDPDYEDDSRHNVMSSIPIEIVPVPADVKKLTINKNSGETLLHRAARIGHEEITLYCLKTQIVDVNARDNAGYTPLHESCVRGSVAVARHLIYHGADVNCCSQDGIRPIHDAIENDHMEVVRLLLVHGADPLIATYAGRTPLRIARSLLMLQTLQGHITDLNGSPGVEEEEEDDDREEDEVVPWRFTLSLTFLERSQIDSYTPCVDMPDDPPDDSSDVFDDGPTAAINVFNLALDGEDRTPQPFCLLDEVINRLNMSEDMLTSLFPWKPTAMTLSSERVREVASCCCSNVSIRLPQSGKVTLLLFSTLNKIEHALKQQMKMKVKKEEGNTGNKEVVKKINSSSCVPILTRLEQANSFLEDGPEHQCLKETALKNLTSSSLSSKQKVKFSGFSSIFQSASTSLATSTSSLNSGNSAISKTSKSQSSSHSWPTLSSEQQSNKKTAGGHHNRHHHHQQKQHAHHMQHQHSQQRPLSSSSGVAGEMSLPVKAPGSTSKDVKSSSSSGSVPRKSKKEDCDNPWLNTPMFSDDSSSSPFHTGLDYLDSDNSI